MEHASHHRTIAFDPSYISKSGKAIPGVGWYRSGCAGKTKWGLEIGGIAAIDIDNHTAFHLEAVQTPQNLKSGNLLEHYADTLVEEKSQLLPISQYVVADEENIKAEHLPALRTPFDFADKHAGHIRTIF